MITINDFLNVVLDDFEEYVNSQDQLCNLLDAHFDAGKIPDYSDEHIQQLYLLRYAYAYAFEYKYMYIKLLNRADFGKAISVTSIGCGNMLDYWSIVHAAKKEKNIYYNGIDAVEWSLLF